MSNYWALLYEVPAAVSLGPLVVNLLPFSLDKKLNPLIMFLSMVVTMLLPEFFSLALAACIPIGYSYGVLGIKLQGHEPVHLPIEETRAVIHKVHKRLRPDPPMPDGPEEDVLTREFPDPAKPPVEKFVPEL